MKIGRKRREKILKYHFLRRFTIPIIASNMGLPRDQVAEVIMRYTVENINSPAAMISPAKIPYFESEKEMLKGPGPYTVSGLSREEKKLILRKDFCNSLPYCLISDNETVGRKTEEI